MQAFETVTNDWQIALLQIFEIFYLKDSSEAKEKGKKWDRIGVCYSSVIQDFLLDIHERRLRADATLK